MCTRAPCVTQIMTRAFLHFLVLSTIKATATAVASLDGATSNFTAYIAKFGRSYEVDSEEFRQRQELFHRRLQQIVAQNSRHDRLWTAGFNELTDRTEGELAKKRGWRHVNQPSAGATALLAESAEVHGKPAEKVDWRNLAMAYDVPDQGGCGSCWAVAAAAMMQGRFEVQRKKIRTFSAQQLVDCVPNPNECGGSGGCQGATVELAMTYVERMGLEAEETSPYLGRDTTCPHPVQTASFLGTSVHLRHRFKGATSIGLEYWRKLPENKALPLMLAVQEGPVAISVAASDWSLYYQGIFDGCPKDAVVDHAVVLFGYGAENGVKYWAVRNSWGRSWGEEGFIRLLRHRTPDEDDAYCGNDDDPGAGLACKPYPKSVRVCGMCGMLYDSVAARFKK